MANDISLTVRLPHGLNSQLQTVSKGLGITKTNLLRFSVYKYLAKEGADLDFSLIPDGKRDRMVFNVNQATFDILKNACGKYGQSMNSVIAAMACQTLRDNAKWP